MSTILLSLVTCKSSHTTEIFAFPTYYVYINLFFNQSHLICFMVKPIVFIQAGKKKLRTYNIKWPT
uniref:Uncharacterized protein n=1 Tax=Kalanchoe fedtschenkoi TaxID=63787 RepID=A0A7N0V995_KALFE